MLFGWGFGFAQEPVEAARPTLAILALQGAFVVPSVPTKPVDARSGSWNRRPLVKSGGSTVGNVRPLGELLVQRIDMAYLRTGRFQMIERGQMGAVLKEGLLQQKGLVDDATAVKLGRQLGARFVVVGSYSGGLAKGVEVTEHVFGQDTQRPVATGKLEVRLRLVRTEDGTILEPVILNVAAHGDQIGQVLDGLMDRFALALDRELAVRYPLTGYVVKVLSDREVLADLGRMHGVGRGDLFLALEVGPDVLHPVKSKVVPGERRAVGELLVIDVGNESSTLRAVAGKVTLVPGCLLERKPK